MSAKVTRSRMFFLCWLCFFALPAAEGAYARDSGEMLYLVPAKPGEEQAIIAKSLLPFLATATGRPVRLVYKPGAEGGTAWAELVRSAPDGLTTAGFTLPHMALQPAQHKRAGQTHDDILPTVIFMSTPCVLAVHADSPYRSLEEFINAARESPGRLSLAGSEKEKAPHIAFLRLKALARVDVAYRPFAVSGEALPVFFNRHVSGMIVPSTAVLQHRKELRILAVASEQRLAIFPDTPTFQEAGYDLVEGVYLGIALPPGAPQTAVDALVNACRLASANPGFKTEMEAQGLVPVLYAPDEALRLIAAKKNVYRQALQTLP